MRQWKPFGKRIGQWKPFGKRRGRIVIAQIPAINLTGTDPGKAGWHRETTPLAAYPPKGEPNIFIIGAYSGTIAGLLIDQEPQAKHYLFEPQDWACKVLRDRFSQYPNVEVCEFGLGDTTGLHKMCLYTSYDCTFLRSQTVMFSDDPAAWHDGWMMEFGDFMEMCQLKSIWYASINIEGYEYALIPYLQETGWLDKIEVLGVSWHDARFNCPVPGPYVWQGNVLPSYEQMQELLAETHKLVLEIDNWQTWVRKDE